MEPAVRNRAGDPPLHRGPSARWLGGLHRQQRPRGARVEISPPPPGTLRIVPDGVETPPPGRRRPASHPVSSRNWRTALHDMAFTVHLFFAHRGFPILQEPSRSVSIPACSCRDTYDWLQSSVWLTSPPDIPSSIRRMTTVSWRLGQVFHGFRRPAPRALPSCRSPVPRATADATMIR